MDYFLIQSDSTLIAYILMNGLGGALIFILLILI